MPTLQEQTNFTPSTAGAGSLTQAQINAELTGALVPVDSVQGASIARPDPVELTVEVPTEIAINKAVVPAAGALSYTGVQSTTEINNTTLVQPVESLKASIQTVLGTVIDTMNSQLGANNTSAQNAIKAVLLLLNNLKSQVNAGFEEISTKEADQSNAVAQAINTVSGQLSSNISMLFGEVTLLNDKIQAMDNEYLTDSDFLGQLKRIIDWASTFRTTDLSALDALKAITIELNSLTRVRSKRVTVSAGTGLFNFNLLNEGFPNFANMNDYTIKAQVIGNRRVSADVINVSTESFDIQLESDGVHFVPQPHDASVTPVVVDVWIAHAKLNPMTFDVDLIKESFVTTGTGTDTVTVG